jgi:hypothetical protein
MGANFALVEATLIATMVTQRFVLDVPAACVVPEATVTLRPRYGLPRDRESALASHRAPGLHATRL